MRLNEQVIALLKQIKITGNRTTMPQLERKLYEQVNKAIELLGGKWNRSARAHVWDCDPNDPIATAVATGEVLDWRKEFQFYETPADVASYMVSAAFRGTSILEPSAGHGAILDAVKKQLKGVREGIALYACELNEGNRAVLNKKHPDVKIVANDFLSYTAGSPDCIVMNPPFNRGQDIAHVRHAYTLLRPGGMMAAITAPGWTFRNDRKHTEFREWFNSLQDAECDDLEAGTFSGTNVATKLLLIEKN